MSSELRDVICRERAVYFRNKLRAARDTALRDSEGYQQVLFSVEQLGRQMWHTAQPRSLGELRCRFSQFVRECLAEQSSCETNFETWFSMMVEGRNDAMHVGAVARRLTASCVRIALTLEDALMASIEEPRIKDYMVCTPVRTYGWQLISLIRQTMLENSFSHLPFLKEYNHDKKDAEWRIVSADAICRYLQNAESKSCMKSRLAKKLDEVCCEEDECLPDKLMTRPASEVGLDASKQDALDKICGDVPVLVIRKKELVGILNAFDLM